MSDDIGPCAGCGAPGEVLVSIQDHQEPTYVYAVCVCRRCERAYVGIQTEVQRLSAQRWIAKHVREMTQ